MASTSKEFQDELTLESEDPTDPYGVRDGTIFILDATAPMFVEDPKEEVPYFLQGIKLYKEILKQKLVWNRQDWMGLVLFGTEKGDEGSFFLNILTLQKLNLVSKNALKHVMNIDEGKKWEYYRDTASASAYPLYDVLWKTCGMFSSVTVTMPIRRLVLFTCQDNPPMTNDDEKRRIIEIANTCNNIGHQLTVVGLGENWNRDVFYKDLEIPSEELDGEDYKRPSLKDLLQQIKFPSRPMANLPWRLGGNVIIDVTIRNICVKRAFLKKTCISKATNAPLISQRYLVTENDSDDNDENKGRKPVPVLETEIRKYQEYGNRKIHFTPTEVLYLGTFCEPGIDLICVKPIFYHPLYHVRGPYFVTPGRKSNRKDNTLLFGALVEKCSSKDLMIICAVTMRKRSSPILYSMIPKAEDGGFYLYKIPYREYVRDLDKICSKYMYNNDDKKKPTEPHEVQLFQKIIRQLNIHYNPSMFSNPKLQAQLQMVETLALDSETPEPPEDNTIPLIDVIQERTKDLMIEYNNIFGSNVASDSPVRKRSRRGTEVLEQATLEDKEAIGKLVQEEKLEDITLTQLQAMSRTLRLKISGKKNELIKRIKEYYD